MFLINFPFLQTVTDVDRCNYPSFQYASKACTELLIDYQADIHAQDEFLDTPLHLASQAGSAGCAGLLIEKGANIEAKNGNGCTPLHLAADCAKVDCLQLLIDNNAGKGDLQES